MKRVHFAFIAATATLAFALQMGPGYARSAASPTGIAEIMQTVQGKTCTTRTGSKFSFGAHGEYNYNGLWKNDGHYKVKPGRIVVTLHSGLERSFAVTVKSGIFYMEDTALSCGSNATVAVLH